MIVAVEAARQGAKMGEDTVLKLMFSDDSVTIPETPEGLKKQTEKVLDNSGKWGLRANVDKCAVVECKKTRRTRQSSSGSRETRDYRW